MPAICPNEELLKAYAWGELPPQLEESLADHLETCPSCQAAVEALERRGDPLLARLRMPVKPDPYLEEPEGREVVQRMLSAISQRGSGNRLSYQKPGFFESTYDQIAEPRG